MRASSLRVDCRGLVRILLIFLTWVLVRQTEEEGVIAEEVCEPRGQVGKDNYVYIDIIKR